MFGLGKKKKEMIGAPIEGEVVPISRVNDPTFSQEIVGKGVAIIPMAGRVTAPTNGRIEMVFDTKHAITMKTEEGAELLIHVGIDTVTLKGEGFEAFVEAGQEVKAGQKLLEFDIETIKKAGLDPISPVVVCNPFNYKKILQHTGRIVKMQNEILTLVK